MRWFTLLLLGSLLLLLPCLAIDYDALEKAWEVGDEAEELRTEGDEHYRQLAAKSEDDAKVLGPQMIFVTMKERREALPDIASRWKEMLWNGGVEVNIYEVAEAKLLVGLQKGLFVNDVMRFLDEQRDVKEYEWNGKTYSKSNKSTKLNHQQRHRQKGTKKTRPKRSKGSKPGKHTHMNGKRTRRKTRHSSVPEEATTKSRNDEL